MASVVMEQGGRRMIQLSPGEHPDRPRIRLGKVSQRQAETVCTYIEDICRAQRTSYPIALATAEWIGGLPHSLRQRLEAFDLIKPQDKRECPTLGQWLEKHLGGRQDVKASTATIFGHTKRNLLAYFGADKRLDEITPGDVDNFRVNLKTREKLAENTIRRRMGLSRQFFRAAMRQKLLAENPFDGQPVQVRENPKRMHFVTHAEAQAVLDACPTAQWRLVFALCRYGGLRCPSEVARLTWADVTWDKARFTVHASKTEHHADAGIRVVPIFPELEKPLLEAYEEAEEGAVYCCPHYKNPDQMYRKLMLKIMQQAGVKPWPKLFQNCRSTRETELAEEYPVQVVCQWIGNSPQVAAKHYLQVTEDHYAKAAQKTVQNPVQKMSEATRSIQQEQIAGAEKAAIYGDSAALQASGEHIEINPLGATGLEPVTSSL